MTVTRTPRDMKTIKTKASRDVWTSRPGHGVTMAENATTPASMRVAADFSHDSENTIHRTPHVPPLYIAIPTEGKASSIGTTDHPIETLTDLWAAVGCRSYWKPPKLLPDHGTYKRLTEKHKNLFTGLMAA